MAPGTDVAGAANRQAESGAGGLRVANNGKGVPAKDIAGEKSAAGRSGGDQPPVLSARERLRLHVNRNLALQQEHSKNSAGNDRGPASAGGPPVAPRGASPGELALQPLKLHGSAPPDMLRGLLDSVRLPCWAADVCPLIIVPVLRFCGNEFPYPCSKLQHTAAAAPRRQARARLSDLGPASFAGCTAAS